MNKLLVLMVVLFILFSCKKKEEQVAATAPEIYSEAHRPKLHFTPEANWMNDPNGLVYLNGEYHLFYQHYPDSTIWGPMHWGHAVSSDLIHWKHLPIALYPDSLGMIFSGSAVIDEKNSSGLGTVENPPMIAVFTLHSAELDKQGRNDFETQGLAFSTDQGRTWTKYAHNPIIKNPGIRDFRDPKVFWHEESKKWVLLLVAQDHAEIYGSKDLLSWNKLSEFGKEYGSHSGVWECPDLFPLPVDGGAKKWVMIININPGGPNGGSGTQYFIGEFDGQKFTPDSKKSKTLWLDYGPDNYAGVTWNNVPEGRRILMGWMSNWEYAQVVPTSPWRSANTVPRDLSIITLNDSLYVSSSVVPELQKSGGEQKELDPLTIKDSLQVTLQTGFSMTTSLISGKLTSEDFVFEFSNSIGQKISIGFDPLRKGYYVDRKQSGKNDFSPAFNNESFAPRKSSGNTFSFTMILDVSSVELFFDDGATVMTSLFFPDAVFTDFTIRKRSKDIQVDSLAVTPLSSTW